MKRLDTFAWIIEQWLWDIGLTHDATDGCDLSNGKTARNGGKAGSRW